MQDRVVMVTGATAGIGKETARRLALRGAKVIVVGRNPERTAATVQEIRDRTESTTVVGAIADLSSLASVRDLAGLVPSMFGGRLHVLINNAGIMASARTATGDGIEADFAVNHVAPFLLTGLLLPLLRANAPARIINVSSFVHKRATIDWEDLQLEQGWTERSAYARSKLANLLTTYEMARRVEGSGVTANAVNPGFVRTNMTARGMVRLAAIFFAKSPKYGATASVYVASNEEAAQLNGAYLNPVHRVVKSSNASYDQQAQRRMWTLTEELIASLPPVTS